MRVDKVYLVSGRDSLDLVSGCEKPLHKQW